MACARRPVLEGRGPSGQGAEGLVGAAGQTRPARWRSVSSVHAAADPVPQNVEHTTNLAYMSRMPVRAVRLSTYPLSVAHVAGALLPGCVSTRFCCAGNDKHASHVRRRFPAKVFIPQLRTLECGMIFLAASFAVR